MRPAPLYKIQAQMADTDIVKREEGELAVSGLNESQIQLLTGATPPDEVRWKKGRGGEKFPYVPVTYTEKILNEAFSLNWSSQIINERYVPNDQEPEQVIVTIRLTIKTPHGDEIVKEQYGSSFVSYYSSGKNKGQMISLGDDLKAAASLALVKCGSLLGVARDVYDKNSDLRKSKGRSQPASRQPQKPPRAAPPPPAPEKAKQTATDVARRVAIKMSYMGIKDRDLAMSILSYLTSVDVTSRKDLLDQGVAGVAMEGLHVFSKIPDARLSGFLVYCMDEGVNWQNTMGLRVAWTRFCEERGFDKKTGEELPSEEQAAAEPDPDAPKSAIIEGAARREPRNAQERMIQKRKEAKGSRLLYGDPDAADQKPQAQAQVDPDEADLFVSG